MGHLIIELKILDTNRLVIPNEYGSGHIPELVLIEAILDQNLQITDHNGRDWEMSLNYDVVANSYLITGGLNSYIDHYHLSASDILRIYKPKQQVHKHHFCIDHDKQLLAAGQSLFVVEVTNSNRLTIPCDLEVVKYFNPSRALPPPDHLQENTLHLIDHLDQTLEMKYICLEDEASYLIFQGWEQYVARYHVNLNHKDTIRFFEKKANPEQNNFIIFHEPGPGPIILSPPSYLEKNFLCEQKLTKEDVEWGRLAMTDVRIEFLCREREIVKLTDEDNKNWYFIIWEVGNGYLIQNGWNEYVRQHKLECGDKVKLYSPEGAKYDKHFLITHIKKTKDSEKEKEENVSSSSKGKE